MADESLTKYRITSGDKIPEMKKYQLNIKSIIIHVPRGSIVTQ